MDKLKEAGLFGGEMISLSGSITERYNQCLDILGVTATSLKKFSIDAMGWSPEIAEEKKNNYYLNIGEANSNAIIISPDQKGKPVQMPFHSFDYDLMHAIFTAYGKPISDITKDSAICVQLDQQIDTYYEPFDLLRFNSITISFKLVNDLEEKQKEQNELIKLFQKDNNFVDLKIHHKILDFARKYGDLRKRDLKLDPLTLKIGSFYTKAFGGLFVLKDFVKDIIVFESKDIFQGAIKNTTYDVDLFHKDHDELIKTLEDYIIAEYNLRKASKTPHYKRIKNHILIENLDSFDHPIDEILDSHFLFKKYLNKLDIETRKKVLSVELYNQRSIIEKELKIKDVVDLQLFKALHNPHSSLVEEDKNLIWKLLIKIAPLDPLYLYWYDKEQFYRTYKTWKPSYQDWVIGCILENNKK